MRDAFINHAPEDRRAALRQLPDLDMRLQHLLESAHLAWPELSLDPARFAAHLGERLPGTVPVEEALASLRGDDLYIACACGLGDETAIAAFRQKLLPMIAFALAPVVQEDWREEIIQRLIGRLFVGGATGPDILKYRGHGKLSAWIHITAVRDAHRFNRGEKADRRTEMDALFDLADTGDDPELANLKQSFQAQFKTAFESAFSKLTPRQRNVLRHEHLDGLNIDQIGVIYGVHRATIARWRMHARDVLLTETRRIFREDYRLSGRDFESAMRLVQSELDVSLPRLLAQSVVED